MLSNFYKELFAPILSLFTSLSTLVCCALPALLVTVGLGTTLVSIVSIFPWIVVLSKYKLTISKGFANTIFGISAGINLNIELMNTKSSDPIREYNSLSLSIIKDLCQEMDFSLD